VKPDLLKVPTDEKAVEAESANFHKLAGILDTQLGQTKWLTGDDVTIADFAVAAPMHLHEASKLPLEQYPNLKRWMTEGMEQLDSWKDTQGAVDKALLPNKQTTKGTNSTNGT
jgi:glutathione S-transferase